MKAIEDEVKRVEGEAKQKDEEARKAHEELQKLSGWRTLTKNAEPINARINDLQRTRGAEHVVSDTSSNSETLRTIEALFIAAVIELGNRFGPEAIFKFIFFAAGVPLLLAPVTADAGMEDKPENVRPVSTSEDPTSPPSRRTTRRRRPKGMQDMSGKVIRFPQAEDARALIAEGKTQKEAAKLLGVTDRTIRRWLSSSKADTCPNEDRPSVTGQDPLRDAA